MIEVNRASSSANEVSIRTWVSGWAERISRQASIPERPGMRTSMTTPWGCSRATASRAASASPASPTTSRSGSVSRRRRRPSRTSSWSSQSRTRMVSLDSMALKSTLMPAQPRPQRTHPDGSSVSAGRALGAPGSRGTVGQRDDAEDDRHDGHGRGQPEAGQGPLLQRHHGCSLVAGRWVAGRNIPSGLTVRAGVGRWSPLGARAGRATRPSFTGTLVVAAPPGRATTATWPHQSSDLFPWSGGCTPEMLRARARGAVWFPRPDRYDPSDLPAAPGADGVGSPPRFRWPQGARRDQSRLAAEAPRQGDVHPEPWAHRLGDHRPTTSGHLLP